MHGLSEAGKPLLVRYDLDALGNAISKEDLLTRQPEFWRYREFLPIRKSENIVRLGEVMTPLLPASKLQKELGCGEILIKDEGRLPTGSFKARGLAVAVAMALTEREAVTARVAVAASMNAAATVSVKLALVVAKDVGETER